MAEAREVASKLQTDAELKDYIRAFRDVLGERQSRRAAVKYMARKAA